jgi:hypothetical protein
LCHGFCAEEKNGSAASELPRSFAADAHDCIMVRVFGPTEYKVVARLMRAPERGLPSDRHPDRIERAAVLGAVKVWPGKRWQAQSAWKGWCDGQP